MSSHDSEPRIDLSLEPQRVLLWLLLIMHTLAIVALFISDLDWSIRVLLGDALAISLLWQLAAHWWRVLPSVVYSATWHSDGHWELTDHRGSGPGVLADYCLGGPFIILKFRKHPAIVLWDHGSTHPTLRRLRVRLRHGRVKLRRNKGNSEWQANASDTATMRD